MARGRLLPNMNPDKWPQFEQLSDPAVGADTWRTTTARSGTTTSLHSSSPEPGCSMARCRSTARRLSRSRRVGTSPAEYTVGRRCQGRPAGAVAVRPSVIDVAAAGGLVAASVTTPPYCQWKAIGTTRVVAVDGPTARDPGPCPSLSRGTTAARQMTPSRVPDRLCSSRSAARSEPASQRVHEVQVR